MLVEVERKLTEGLPPETAPLKEEQKAEIPPIMLPEVPAPKPAAEPQPAVHTVRPGQSLWSIATDKLGNGERYREILELNPGLRGDPGNIRPGQELVLPPG